MAAMTRRGASRRSKSPRGGRGMDLDIGDAMELRSDASELSISPRDIADGLSCFSHGLLLPGSILDNQAVLSDEEIGLATMLCENHQTHLMDDWPMPGTDDDKKHAFFSQVKSLHETYPAPGGLPVYIERARSMLAAAQKDGINPLAGWTPSVPEGETLHPGTEEYALLEDEGLEEVKRCGFVLVAGGLGERLGYGDIKLRLPSETATGVSYLELYISQILALQARYGEGKRLPLSIMVSDDTIDGTRQMLEEGGYFGMEKEQVTLMKQEKVAALQDTDGGLALDPSDKFVILTKPHGHGDVHSLMHSTGTAQAWRASGCAWLVFMQDTNGLALHTLAPTLGVSKRLQLEVNSMAVPRKAKQAVGGITTLTHHDGRQMTVNVEYNQLDPLLRDTDKAQGGGGGDVNDPVTGYSPYPGNINQLVFQLAPYCQVLEETGGVLGEFVNPKYADESRTVFKKPTRLECMMQDYPKGLGPDAIVGFTMVEPWLCFSPVKNNVKDAVKAQGSGTPPAAAVTAEGDQYFVWGEMMRKLGCVVEKAPEKDWVGVKASLGPQIVMHPSTAIFYSELGSCLPNPSRVTISSRSALVVKGGEVTIEALDLDGALVIEVEEGSSLVIRNLTLRNAGWALTPLEGGEGDLGGAKECPEGVIPESLQIRGFTVYRKATYEIKVNAEEGDRIIDDIANPNDQAS